MGKIENDFVKTPVETTELLLSLEKFEGNILEPCCGDGAISKVLLNKGYEVYSSDLIDYGFGSVINLFDINEKYDNIVTNPPFNQKLARFSSVKKHLLTITKKKLVLLWFVKNLGNEVEAKTSKYLRNVYVINKKIDFKEINFGWLFAWYIWDKDYEGDTIIKRIRG